jgi:hypothetical protein
MALCFFIHSLSQSPLADVILLELSGRDKENEQYQKVRYSEDINEKYKRRNARV